MVREPALSVALWLSWGAVLGAVACATAVMIQHTELQALRREVSRLQRTEGTSVKGAGHPWSGLQKQVSEGRCLVEEDGRALSSLGLWAPACRPDKLGGCKSEDPTFGGQGSSHSRQGNC